MLTLNQQRKKWTWEMLLYCNFKATEWNNLMYSYNAYKDISHLILKNAIILIICTCLKIFFLVPRT